jgi:transposase
MNNKTNRIVSELSIAITAIMSGDDVTATKATAQALRALTSGTTSSVSHVAKAVAKTTAKTTAKKAKGYKSNQRGPKPALNNAQVMSLVERVRNGESIVNVAEALKVSYATAHRYLKMHRDAEAKANAEATTSTN